MQRGGAAARQRPRQLVVRLGGGAAGSRTGRARRGRCRPCRAAAGRALSLPLSRCRGRAILPPGRTAAAATTAAAAAGYRVLLVLAARPRRPRRRPGASQRRWALALVVLLLVTPIHLHGITGRPHLRVMVVVVAAGAGAAAHLLLPLLVRALPPRPIALAIPPAPAAAPARMGPRQQVRGVNGGLGAVIAAVTPVAAAAGGTARPPAALGSPRRPRPTGTATPSTCPCPWPAAFVVLEGQVHGCIWWAQTHTRP